MGRYYRSFRGDMKYGLSPKTIIPIANIEAVPTPFYDTLDPLAMLCWDQRAWWLGVHLSSLSVPAYPGTCCDVVVKCSL